MKNKIKINDYENIYFYCQQPLDYIYTYFFKKYIEKKKTI